MVDWRTWLAFAFAVAMVFIVIDRDRLAEARDNAVSVEAEGQKERARLLAGQQDLQDQVDRLVSQNNALVELFRSSGIDVPAGLVAGRSGGGTVTRIETGGDNDNDDDGDGDTIIVRPPTSSPPRPSPTANPPDDDDGGGTRIQLPKVPLPDEAGEATDTTKRIVDDLTGIKLD